MVRELIGPIASFRIAAAVRGLPRTRSGKTARKSIAELARNKFVKVVIINLIETFNSSCVFHYFQNTNKSFING